MVIITAMPQKLGNTFEVMEPGRPTVKRTSLLVTLSAKIYDPNPKFQVPFFRRFVSRYDEFPQRPRIEEMIIILVENHDRR